LVTSSLGSGLISTLSAKGLILVAIIPPLLLFVSNLKNHLFLP
jgi:hypothetical protein